MKSKSVILFLLLMLLSCAPDRGNVEVYLVRSPLVQEDPLDPDLVSHLAIHVSGSGIQPYEDVFKFTRGGTSMLPDIAAGEEIVITVEGLAGKDGYAVSRGRSLPVTITDKTLKVELFMARIGRFSITPGYGLTQARFGHASADSLQGQLYIIGGAAGGSMDSPESLLSSLEIFDPTSGMTDYFSCGGSSQLCLEHPRTGSYAVPVNNGFFVSGGTGRSGLLDSVDFIDTSSLVHESADLQVEKRQDAVMLTVEEQTLLAGGIDQKGNPLNTAELISMEGGIEKLVMPVARWGSAAAVSDQTGVIFGGYNEKNETALGFLLFDFSKKTFSVHSSRTHSRIWASAAGLPDGRVLFIGGLDGNDEVSASVDVFIPALSQICPLGQMLRERWLASVALLPDGRVLVMGGLMTGGEPTADTEILDPRYIQFGSGCREMTGALSSIRVPGMRFRRYAATSHLLANGAVAVVGGLDQNDRPLKQIEFFVPEE